MPTPRGIRDAGEAAPRLGPRVSEGPKPKLPRTISTVKWPDHLPDHDSKQDCDPKHSGKLHGIPETPGSSRGWSKFTSKNPKTSGDDTGPRMLSWSMPPMLRAGTALSLDSAASSQKDVVLTKGASKMSFTTWLSGDSSAPEKKRKQKRQQTEKSRSQSDDDLTANGERCIQFLESCGRIVVRPESINTRSKGKPNMIRTARFTLTTWLPLSLFYQFQRVANIYFLLICGLVMFPWSPKDWRSKVFPFLFVLLWTALKDLHEDRQRRRDDDNENKQKATYFDTNGRSFSVTAWKDLFVGDVVLVHCDEAFPADLVLLHIAEGAEGFISTMSLDGEANLKERRPPQIFEKASRGASQHEKAGNEEAMSIMNALFASHIETQMGSPSFAVHDVKGSACSEEDECPIGVQNFLPRGCTLRNTDWILGLVVYVGDETKTRMNSAKSHSKFSNMQVYLNYCIWGLLVGIVCLCLYSATASALKDRSNMSFCCSDDSWLVKLGVFLITFYHVVPMSLYVVFEMLKLLLGYNVTNDPQMFCPETQEYAMARTADLIEEMGQVNFIFSDKTGTLTRNEMVFAGCCIDGVDLGDFRRTEHDKDPEGVLKVRSLLKKGEDENRCHSCPPEDFFSGTAAPDLVRDVQWFFTCIAVCHTVQVRPAKAREISVKAEDSLRTPSTREPSHTGSFSAYVKPAYLGMSPDEVALVEAACEAGIVFEERKRIAGEGTDATSELVLNMQGINQITSFEILHELEFNSDRKRMSIVCRHENQIFCLTKGADVVMESLTQGGLSTSYKESLRSFSQQGLRTLVIAAKKVDEAYFKKWEAQYKSALGCLDDRKDEWVSRKAAEMEQDLKILGITAVEDRLQDGVPEAIEILKQAGIRVWVLTGDKMETAVDIAHSCLLFREQTKLSYGVGAECVDDALQALRRAKEELKGLSDGGLVLDGITIQHAIGDSRCEDLLYELGLASRSCVCCRLTPLQKRQLVELVQARSPSTITLAIGDGANDVPMLEGAHLGIGIRGKEGRQAVQVSDVAISQFRFLVPLLLCHGRRAYRRVAIFLCFYLYKNLVLAMGDISWMHQDEYNGRIAFPEYLSINFNFLFTSWHILFILGFDQDVPDHVANTHPEIYLVGPRRQLFNWVVFSRWMAYAVFHGCAAWLVPSLWFGGDAYSKKTPSQFWVGSTASFTIIVNVVMLRLFLVSEAPLRPMTSILPSLTAYAMYVACLMGIGYTSIGHNFQPNMESVPEEVFKQKEALISIFAVPIGCIAVDFFFETLRVTLFPTELDRLRWMLRSGLFKQEDIRRRMSE